MQGYFWLLFLAALLLTSAYPSYDYNRGYCDTVRVCTDADALRKIPVIEDCNQYVFCELFGYNETFNCEIGLHFNEPQQACLDPDLAMCLDCSGTTTLEPSSTTITDTSTTWESTTIRTTERITTPVITTERFTTVTTPTPVKTTERFINLKYN